MFNTHQLYFVNRKWMLRLKKIIESAETNSINWENNIGHKFDSEAIYFHSSLVI